MAAVKAILDLIDQGACVPVDAVERDVDLENLFAVAHLGGSFDSDGAVEPGAEPGGGRLLQFGKQLAHLARRNALPAP